MTNKEANIIEIFSSIQGEGPYIGARQLFIRFAGCNLSCKYCDTKFASQEFCNVEICPGSGNFKEIKNPFTAEQLIYKINELTYFHHQSISLTGGEPLYQSDFLTEFLSEFTMKKNDRNLRVYLETNGTLPQELKKVINYTDIISMDIKLESSTGVKTPYDSHREFICIARDSNKDIFIKAVITSKITVEEIDELANFIKSIDKDICLILQPISSSDKNLLVSPNQLMSIQESLLRDLPDVRVIPQVHKYLDLL